MSKGIKVMERTRMRLQTDTMLIAILPELISRGIKKDVAGQCSAPKSCFASKNFNQTLNIFFL